jgi:signal peptidase II
MHVSARGERKSDKLQSGCCHRREALMLKRILILAILLSCVGCDQTSKSVAVTYLSAMHTLSFVGDSVRLQIAHNSGAFLSLGESLPEALRSALLILGVGMLLLGLLVYGFLSKNLTALAAACLGLIVGGGASNLLDRLRYDGHVIDFINIGIGPLRTGIFNLADVCITAGFIGWVLTRRPRAVTSED